MWINVLFLWFRTARDSCVGDLDLCRFFIFRTRMMHRAEQQQTDASGESYIIYANAWVVKVSRNCFHLKPKTPVVNMKQHHFRQNWFTVWINSDRGCRKAPSVKQGLDFKGRAFWEDSKQTTIKPPWQCKRVGAMKTYTGQLAAFLELLEYPWSQVKSSSSLKFPPSLLL